MGEHQIKSALAATQWEELKQTLRKECSAIKQTSSLTLEFESVSLWEARLRNMRTGQVVTLRYNPAVPCIHYATPKQNGHFAFQASADGRSLQFMDDGIPKKMHELSMRIIQQIRNR
jgi:hypothetical protein